MAITLSFVGQLNVNDSILGTTALSKQLTALSTTGTVFSEANQLTIGTSPVSISLPVSPVNFVYLKNLHATNTIVVIWTPNSGASATIITLQPGAFIAFSENSGAQGISALSVTGSGAGTTLEFVIGG